MFHLFNVVFGYATFCIFTLTVLGLGNLAYNIFFHPLRHYPGPKLWAATRLTWTWSVQSGHFHKRLHELHTRYGSVVRIAPNELSYIDSQAWNDIYKPHSGSQVMPKNGIWGKQPPGAPHSIATADEAAHTRNRRALMGAFTDKAVAEHAPVLESFVDLMISKFKEQTASNGQTIVDMVSWLNFLTFDISGMLSFGEPFDCLKNGKAHPWVDISVNFGKGLILVATVNFYSPLDKLLQLSIPKSVLEKMQYHKELARSRTLQRLNMADRAKARDFVGSISQYNQQKGEVKIPHAELESNMVVLIFASAETTSTAMASILTALLRSPESLRKVQDEVRKAFRSEEEIKIPTVAHLDYLNAVIQEGIRLGPATAIGIPRVVPKAGETICGRWVPGGTFVSLNQYPAFRSPKNFSQPDEFVPERFTTSSPFPNDNLAVFEPFLTGRHKCLGQKLAMSEMRLTLARILYTFDLRAVEPVKDFGEQETYLLWQKVPLNVELKVRE